MELIELNGFQQQNLPCAAYIVPIEAHSAIKQNLLNTIMSVGEFSIKDNHQKISNTDWHLGRDHNRPYGDICLPHINEKLKQFSDTEAGSLKIHNYWFQQYETGDFHNWHRHGETMFNSVYFVELPYKDAATQFKFNGEEFSVNVREGDLLIFPSYLMHRSPKNTGNRKTVVAVNFSM